jgi:hypothetical protein
MTNLLTRILASLVGLGLLVVGAVKVIAGTGATGAISLVAVGAVLAVIPFVINRVEQVSVSGTGFELRLTREISDLGAPKAAQILDRSDLGSFAESYAFIHEELRDVAYRDARVHLQDLLVERAAALARREKFDPLEVRTVFKNGSPMIRVLMLGVMEGDPSLADGSSIISAIADSRSANEQYHGLRLALLCWSKLPESERYAIQGAVAGNHHIQPGGDRQVLANEVLALPAAQPPADRFAST